MRLLEFEPLMRSEIFVALRGHLEIRQLDSRATSEYSMSFHCVVDLLRPARRRASVVLE